MKNSIYLIILFIIFHFNKLLSIEFSKNNVLKFTSKDLKYYNNLQDQDNIFISENYIEILDKEKDKGWLITEYLPFDNNYVIDSIFVIFDKTNNESFLNNSNNLKVIIRETKNDKIVFSYNFIESESIKFTNVLDFPIYIYLEFDKNIYINSFGITRKEKIYLDENHIEIFPKIMYVNEDILNIKFKLYYPQKLDIIIFDRVGSIITYIERKKFFLEGEYIINWGPNKKYLDKLNSGNSYIYFKVYKDEMIEKEIVKSFYIVNK